MQFSETCITVPATWQLPPDLLRAGLNWWAHHYRNGTRITMADGQFVFTRAMNHWDRLSTFGQFGRFPKPSPVPSPADIESHAPALRCLLQQPVPAAYGRYFYHLLCKDHELEKIEDSAGQMMHKIGGIPCQGGYFPVYYGKRAEAPATEKRRKLVDLPPILAKFKPMAI